MRASNRLLRRASSRNCVNYAGTSLSRYNNATEVLEEADGWENLRLPPAVRRRLQETDATPIEFIDTVRYRLLGKREEVPTSRSA